MWPHSVVKMRVMNRCTVTSSAPHRPWGAFTVRPSWAVGALAVVLAGAPAPGHAADPSAPASAPTAAGPWPVARAAPSPLPVDPAVAELPLWGELADARALLDDLAGEPGGPDHDALVREAQRTFDCWQAAAAAYRPTEGHPCRIGFYTAVDGLRAIHDGEPQEDRSELLADLHQEAADAEAADAAVGGRAPLLFEVPDAGEGRSPDETAALVREVAHEAARAAAARPAWRLSVEGAPQERSAARAILADRGLYPEDLSSEPPPEGVMAEPEGGLRILLLPPRLGPDNGATTAGTTLTVGTTGHGTARFLARH